MPILVAFGNHYVDLVFQYLKKFQPWLDVTLQEIHIPTSHSLKITRSLLVFGNLGKAPQYLSPRTVYQNTGIEFYLHQGDKPTQELGSLITYYFQGDLFIIEPPGVYIGNPSYREMELFGDLMIQLQRAIASRLLNHYTDFVTSLRGPA